MGKLSLIILPKMTLAGSRGTRIGLGDLAPNSAASASMPCCLYQPSRQHRWDREPGVQDGQHPLTEEAAPVQALTVDPWGALVFSPSPAIDPQILFRGYPGFPS